MTAREQLIADLKAISRKAETFPKDPSIRTIGIVVHCLLAVLCLGGGPEFLFGEIVYKYCQEQNDILESSDPERN
jgi:hypothetical protein